MSSHPFRVFLVGEGPNDIGDLHRDPTYRGEREGFMQPVLRRLSGRSLKFSGQKVTSLPKKPSRSPGHGRKAEQALALAWADGADVLVFVKDTDGNDAGAVKAEIEAGFKEARSRTSDFSDLVALAATPHPMIEPWALADRNALAAHTGRKLAELKYRRPEALWGKEEDPSSNHPKCVLKRALGREPTTEDFAQLAESADLKTLRRECPVSFAPFADDVAAGIGDRDSE